MRQLPTEERARAWAIHLFMLYDQGYLLQDSQVDYFTQCVEKAAWPEDGLFPTVSKKTAERLGLNDPKWDSWKRFSSLHALLYKAKKMFCKNSCAV
jgi:hypothetical protein